MQFQGKHMTQTQGNDEKPHYGHDLGPLGPNSVTKFFFFKYLASLVTRYHGQLSLCTISEKTNYTILRKFSEGQTEGQDRRMTRVIS